MSTLGPGRAWQTYEVTTHSDGSASVRVLTSSTLDGETRSNRETMEFATLDEALQRTGKSRISGSGVLVTVRIDGAEYVG
jgi:hypothetical protein